MNWYVSNPCTPSAASTACPACPQIICHRRWCIQLCSVPQAQAPGHQPGKGQTECREVQRRHGRFNSHLRHSTERDFLRSQKKNTANNLFLSAKSWFFLFCDRPQPKSIHFASPFYCSRGGGLLRLTWPKTIVSKKVCTLWWLWAPQLLAHRFSNAQYHTHAYIDKTAENTK